MDTSKRQTKMSRHEVRWKDCVYWEKVVLKCKSEMSLGDGVSIQNGVYLDALSRTGLVLDEGSSLGSGTIVRCSGNYRELGQWFI